MDILLEGLALNWPNLIGFAMLALMAREQLKAQQDTINKLIEIRVQQANGFASNHNQSPRV